LKRLILLLAAGLLGLAGCTEYGYVKPGVTEEVYAQDSEDCAEIARHQAFRDFNVFETRGRFRGSVHDRRRYTTFDPLVLSPGELEFRYRRICMLSRGYELAPLDDQGDDEGEDQGDSDGPEDAEGG